MKTSFLRGICLFAVLLFGAGHLQLAFGGDEEKIQIKRNIYKPEVWDFSDLLPPDFRFPYGWTPPSPYGEPEPPGDKPEPKTEVKPTEVDPIMYWLMGLGIPLDLLYGGGGMSSVEPPKLELQDEKDPPIESVLNDLGRTFVLDDGTVVTIYGNGLRITSYKDGTSVTVDPKAGTKTTRDKDGKVTKEERLDSKGGGTTGGDPGPPPGRGGSSTQTATGTTTPTPGTQAKEKADQDKFNREVSDLRDKIDKEKNPRRRARLVRDLNEKYKERFGAQTPGPVH